MSCLNLTTAPGRGSGRGSEAAAPRAVLREGQLVDRYIPMSTDSNLLFNVISVESFHSSKLAVVLEERIYLPVSVSPLPVRSHSAGPGRVRGWAACKSEIANISPLSNGAQQPPHTS